MYKRFFLILYLTGSTVLFLYSLQYCLKNNIFYDLSFIDNLESTMESIFLYKPVVREIYGGTNKLLSPNEIASGSGAVVKDKDGFLEPIEIVTYDITDAEDKINELKVICQNAGTQFAYISYPSKTNSNTKSESFGIDTNQEETRKEFLAALKANEVDVLDVRELMEAEGYTSKDVFYKTDHHWKSTAGLYCARAVADFLNDMFDYSLRADLLDENLFAFTEYDDIWFGETGRKYSLTWAGTLDGFTEIVPIYDTAIKLGSQYGSYDRSGDFKIFVDESGYHGGVDLYRYSAHYSYGVGIYSPGVGICSPTWIHNDNISGEKILIIKDSFSMVVIPFLSLTTSDIATWDMRVTPTGLYDYIKQNNFDIVLLAYTDFWTANMYDFQ